MRIKILTAATASLAALGVGAGIYFAAGSGGSGATPEEKTAIAASNGLVKRDKDGLKLALDGGAALNLADLQRCGDVACPPRLARTVRYKGWDDALGGYRLTLDGRDLLLPFGTEAQLQDPAHADLPASGSMELPSPQPPRSAADDSVTQWLQEIAQGRDNDEAKTIDATKGKAERKGPDLILTLDDGKRLVVSDQLACGQAACPAPLFRAYAFAGMASDGHHYLIEERQDEAVTLLHVSLTDGSISPASKKP